MGDDEDARGTLAGQRALARLKAGDDELIPHDVVKRIGIDGEHPVRVFREYRGLAGAQLAARVGVDQSTISNLETGKREEKLRLLLKIARALAVSLEDLVPADMARA